MLFYVRYKGKEHKVRVESRQQKLFIAYDSGPEEEVDLSFYGNDCTFLKDGRVFYANVAGNQTDYKVWRPEGMMNFSIESEYKRIVSRLRGQNLEDDNKITAKMPGKVVKIQVKKGDTLKEGDPVMILEAMKMENEITANIEGTVKSLSVKEGQTVDAGELLAELDPKKS